MQKSWRGFFDADRATADLEPHLRFLSCTPGVFDENHKPSVDELRCLCCSSRPLSTCFRRGCAGLPMSLCTRWRLAALRGANRSVIWLKYAPRPQVVKLR